MASFYIIMASSLFVFSMLAAFFCDLTTLKIPNIYILLLLLGFCVLAPFSNLTLFGFLQYHLSVALCFLFIGFALFAKGYMGAGDVKLISATALWLGFPLALQYLFLASVLGGIFAFALLVWRKYPLPIFAMKINWLSQLHFRGAGLPYGVALGPCGLYFFPYSFWFF